MPTRVIDETQELCPLCGGTGQERSYNTTAIWQTCTRCNGSRFIVTKRTVRYEDRPPVKESA